MKQAAVLMLLMGFVLPAPPVAAMLLNGEFEQGLDDWTTHGDVRPVSETAALGDRTIAYSTLYQALAWPSASFTLSFDFRSQLSADMPQGTLPDVLFASVYYVDDLSSFDPERGQFDAADALLDLSAGGPYNVQGVLGSSPKGDDWTRFTIDLPLAHQYVIPFFELHDLNHVRDDSLVDLDNILVAPEPGALALILCGFALAFLFTDRRTGLRE